ncbi:MAG TPA: flavodoxin family protein [Candidatus Cloacimonadota bacterium]|nr:flavodoxin family protein [Candidatus Cloacimonadota bacterium]HPT72260.1 flavodoxin family protein [Candidatus Cloacimonadota bacterium]
MKILGIISSARKNGFSARLVHALIDEAKKKGHKTEIISLYDLNFKSCGVCDTMEKLPAKQYCALKDDLTPVMHKFIEADCVILSSPIYMDYLSGTLKTFFDRWCIFVGGDMNVTFTPGKKYISILVSGAAPKYYSWIQKKMDMTLTGFFKMEKIGSLFFGNSMEEDAEKQFALYVKNARKLIEKL